MFYPNKQANKLINQQTNPQFANPKFTNSQPGHLLLLEKRHAKNYRY